MKRFGFLAVVAVFFACLFTVGVVSVRKTEPQAQPKVFLKEDCKPGHLGPIPNPGEAKLVNFAWGEYSDCCQYCVDNVGATEADVCYINGTLPCPQGGPPFYGTCEEYCANGGGGQPSHFDPHRLNYFTEVFTIPDSVPVVSFPTDDRRPTSEEIHDAVRSTPYLGPYTGYTIEFDCGADTGNYTYFYVLDDQNP